MAFPPDPNPQPWPTPCTESAYFSINPGFSTITVSASISGTATVSPIAFCGPGGSTTCSIGGTVSCTASGTYVYDYTIFSSPSVSPPANPAAPNEFISWNVQTCCNPNSESGYLSGCPIITPYYPLAGYVQFGSVSQGTTGSLTGTGCGDSSCSGNTSASCTGTLRLQFSINNRIVAGVCQFQLVVTLGAGFSGTISCSPSTGPWGRLYGAAEPNNIPKWTSAWLTIAELIGTNSTTISYGAGSAYTLDISVECS